MLTPYLLLPVIQSLMLELWDRRLLPESVYCSAPPGLNEGCFWAVKLDVRDLGGHLDVTMRALAGTLSSRVKLAITQVIAVGALPMEVNECLGWCAQNNCLVGFMPSLSAHSVHFVLR